MKTVTKKIKVASTRLERVVQRWINEKGADYESGVEGALSDLFYGGCASGMVSELIYYSDTLKFFSTHRREISQLLTDSLENYGSGSPSDLFGDKWDSSDPLAQEASNRNLLAWFAFEETARNLAAKAEIEI